jgi:hypothetical protein
MTTNNNHPQPASIIAAQDKAAAHDLFVKHAVADLLATHEVQADGDDLECCANYDLDMPSDRALCGIFSLWFNENYDYMLSQFDYLIDNAVSGQFDAGYWETMGFWCAMSMCGAGCGFLDLQSKDATLETARTNPVALIAAELDRRVTRMEFNFYFENGVVKFDHPSVCGKPIIGNDTLDRANAINRMLDIEQGRYIFGTSKSGEPIWLPIAEQGNLNEYDWNDEPLQYIDCWAWRYCPDIDENWYGGFKTRDAAFRNAYEIHLEGLPQEMRTETDVPYDDDDWAWRTLATYENYDLLGIEAEANGESYGEMILTGEPVPAEAITSPATA